jgi:probable HAF family extracellular repeat protein
MSEGSYRRGRYLVSLVLFLLSPLPGVAREDTARKAVAPRFDVRDLGGFGGSFVRASGIGPGGTVVGQAEVVRRNRSLIGGNSAPAGAVSYFDPDASFGRFIGFITNTPRHLQDSFAPDWDGYGRRIGNYLVPTTTTARRQPFLFSGGRAVILPTPGTGFATAVNARGDVVGSAEFSPVGRNVTAFLYRADTRKIKPLGTFGGSNSVAYDINARSQVVGDAEQRGDVPRAFLWDGGSLRDLGTLGGSRGHARAINESGQVVGWAEDSRYRERPVSWDSDGAIRELETPAGAASAHALALNESGFAVGRAFRANGEPYPVLWDRRGRVLSLGGQFVLTGEALGVNRFCEVVGEMRTLSGQPRAFLWRGSRLYDLNGCAPANSGWTLQRAVAIGPDGSVTGWGAYKGQTRAFLMTPVR